MKKAKKSAKAAKKASKPKLDQLSQAHGKEEKYQPTTLDQIWGDEGLGRYGTVDEETYNKEISDMTRTDIQSHAVELGIVPVEDRVALEKRLTSEFKRHVAQYRKPAASNDVKLKKSDLSEDALKVLKEGG